MGDVTTDLSYVLNGTTTPTQALPGAQEALVISADPVAGVMVRIPSYSPDWAFGPAKFTWPGPGPLPPVNTPCLVEFVGTDLSDPWIVSWGTVTGGTPSLGGTPLSAPGATSPTRYVGATASGPPTSGIFAVGDLSVDLTGLLWVCTVAGTPGTWRSSQDRPTGSIDAVLAPQPNQLLLQGQTISRTTYARLFAWVQSKNLLGTAAGQMFGVGDGSTTFVLPDWRAKILRGVAATGESLGLAVGADSQALTLAQMAAHNHSVSAVHSTPHTHGFSTSQDGQHQHGFLTDQQGAHGGHFPAGGPVYVAPQANASGVAAWNDGGSGVGTHNHGGTTAYNSNHGHTGTTGTDGVYTHTITQATIGAGSPVDMRQASVGVQWAIWT